MQTRKRKRKIRKALDQRHQKVKRLTIKEEEKKKKKKKKKKKRLMMSNREVKEYLSHHHLPQLLEVRHFCL